MSQLSALIGKSVLNVTTSCIIGKVTDVYFDEYLKNAVYFCIEASDDKSEYLLEYAEAQSIVDAVVIADDVKFLSPLDLDLTTLHSRVLSMPVYTPSGISKGKLTDIVVTLSGKVIRLTTATNEFTPSSILSIGNVIIQKGASKSKARKVTIPRPKEDYPVYILNDTKKVLEIEKSILAGKAQIPSIATARTETTANVHSSSDAPVATVASAIKSTDAPEAPSVPSVLTVPTTQTQSSVATPEAPTTVTSATKSATVPVAPVKVAKIHTLAKKEPVLSNGAFEMLLDGSNAYSYDEDARTPTRVICDYEFLLGRTLGADLTTYTGELIAKQNSVVTDATVEKARKAGKLVELTLNSVKPQKQN